MSGINQHTILGNVGKIETRYSGDGNAIVNMSIATSEKWKDKATGEMKEKTDWHNVVVFGKPAEIIGQYVTKGDKIYIQGKVVTRKWQDQQGADRYSTETVVDGFNGKFELLGSKSGNQQPQVPQVPQVPQQQQSRPAPPPEPTQQGAYNRNDPPGQDDFNDSIPF